MGVLGRLRKETQSYYLVGYVFANGLASLIIIPLLARNLSIAELGMFSAFSGLAFFFQMFIEAGFNTLGPKTLVETSAGEDDRSVIIKVTYCKFILTIMFGIIAVPLHIYIGQRLGRTLESMVLLLASIITAFNPNWVLITRGKAKLFFFTSLLIRLGYLGGIVYFCRRGMSLLALSNLQALVALVGVGISYFQIKGFSLRWLTSSRPAGLARYLKESALLFVGNISDVALYGLSPAILSRICGPEQVAFLFAVDKLRLLTTDIMGMLTRRMFSEIFSQSNFPGIEGKKENGILFPILGLAVAGLLISVGIVACSKLIILMFGGNKFISAKKGIAIFSVFPLLMAAATASMLFGLIRKGLYKEYAWASLSASMIGLLALPFMAVKNGYIAVIYAWIIAQILKSLFAYFFRLLPEKKYGV